MLRVRGAVVGKAAGPGLHLLLHQRGAESHFVAEVGGDAGVLEQRAHAGEYLWFFRKDEGVDISFVKDWADLNHTNLVSPHINQLYIGWTENGEWVNYTVHVARPGAYRIKALYSFQTNTVTFDLNGKLAATCRLPVLTANYHQWNFGTIGTIQVPEAGPQRWRSPEVWRGWRGWFHWI